MVEHHQGYRLATNVNDPDLTVRENDLVEPSVYLLIVVDGWRY